MPAMKSVSHGKLTSLHFVLYCIISRLNVYSIWFARKTDISTNMVLLPNRGYIISVRRYGYTNNQCYEMLTLLSQRSLAELLFTAAVAAVAAAASNPKCCRSIALPVLHVFDDVMRLCALDP